MGFEEARYGIEILPMFLVVCPHSYSLMAFALLL
jgi:hypothetical protein